MTDAELLKQAIELSSTKECDYFKCAELAAKYLSKKYAEQLYQLVNGPVYDGDIISKVDRDYLLSIGLAVRVCHKGEQGYTAATYFAYSVNKEVQKILELNRSKATCI